MITWLFEGTKGIWAYDGSLGQDDHYGKNNFEKCDSNIERRHRIKLTNASLSNEGMYTCQVQYHDSGVYFEGKSDMQLTVIGLYMVFISSLLKQG